MTRGPEGSGVADDRALGCAVRLVVTDAGRLPAAKAALDGVLRQVDEACSRFRPDSELSRLHRRPGRPALVSPLLAEALKAALAAAQATDGAVDPTVGRALRAAGYDRDFAAVPAEGPALRLRARPVAGWRAVAFDAGTRLLTLAPGIELDLGATAKALAADLGAAAALAAAGGGALVSLGGDIAIRGEAPAGGWRVQVGEHGTEPAVAGAELIRAGACGIATSSTTVRRWRRGGKLFHHIIDPATGLPATGPWRTATVVAASCVDANTASTAAIVFGERAPAWLEAAELPARLVDQSGAVTRLAGWPEPL